jgi:pimeloyl-ACP methyl ester carboxylesterase
MYQKKQLFLIALIVCMSTLVFSQKKSFHTSKAPAPEAGSMFIFPERIMLEEGGFYNAERATFFVPLNRSKKDSDVISLDVYRFKASAKADPNTPPLFYLHGGPSFQGLEDQLEQLGNFEKKWQYLLDVSDVVIVSQRGIGPSKPTTTVERTVEAMPTDVAYNDDLATVKYQKLLTKERKTWEELGLDLKGYTVLEAAEDVNDVRKAFGYDKISILGGSFGSHWGMILMRKYPEIIARAILTGVEGPDHTYDHPGHAWNVFKRMAEEAENSPALKGLIPEGGLIAAVEAIQGRLKANPFTIEVIDPKTKKITKVLFDASSAKKLARGYSNKLESWPADIITLYNGDYTEAAKKFVRSYNNRSRNLKTASYFMLDCGSGITMERLEEYLTDPANDIIETGWGYIKGCPCWDSDLGDDFRQNFETDIPTVLVQGTWDRSTPFENALELAPYFKNIKFVAVKRGPHSALRVTMAQSEDFKKGIVEFLKSGDNSSLPNKIANPTPQWVIPKLK